jgi:excisionase family DNA binding protein
MSSVPSPLHLPRLLEVHEVAYQLKCSQETVRRLFRSGKLTGVRLGNQWRVDPDDLHAFIEAQKVRIAAAERGLDQQFAAASARVEEFRRERPDKATA